MQRIYFFLGTKGQLIKTAPVMKYLKEAGVDIVFINSGQHAGVFSDLVDFFGLKKPDFELCKRKTEVSTAFEGFIHALKSTVNAFVNRGEIFSKKGLVVVHGDALPAFLGLFLAKVRSLKVVHIEAGERTHKLFNPFPEEIIRRLVDRYSDLMFSLSEDSHKNLVSEGLRGEIVDVGVNTVFDSVKLAVDKGGSVGSEREYALVSIHRVESIRSKRKLVWILDTVNKMSERMDVVFPIHKSTRAALEKFDLLDRIFSNERIEILDLQDYPDFIKLIKNAKMIFTDGGGPQCESYFLGTPCLLARDTTEYPHCENTFVSMFSDEKTVYFLENIRRYEVSFELSSSPSELIAEKLVDFIK